MEIDNLIEAVYLFRHNAKKEPDDEPQLYIYMNEKYWRDMMISDRSRYIGETREFQNSNGETLLGFHVFRVNDISHPNYKIVEV